MSVNSIPFIIGAGGQVGRSLVEELNRQKKIFYCSTRKENGSPFFLDLENPTSIASALKAFAESIGKNRGVVFLTGAYTHVDGCEQNPQKSYAINALAPELIALECARLGLHFLFFSSEYVFGNQEYLDGTKGPFSEEDPVAPSSAYGKHKAEAEIKIISLRKQLSYTIIRTTMVFSWNKNDMNFPMQLYRFLAEPMPEKRFKIPTDQISTPTYAKGLAQAALELAEKKAQGIFHVVGSDLLSRSDFTLRLIELFGFSREQSLSRIDFFETTAIQQIARRPLSAGLKTEKARASGVQIWSLAQAFGEFPKEWVASKF